MARGLVIFLVLTAHAALASAQPGQTLPPAAPEPPRPMVSPKLELTPDRFVEVTAEERELLLRGEIGIGRYIVGGVLSYPIGFGVGQAVQGRWNETGWIYTFADSAMLSTIFYGATRCYDDCTVLVIGALGFAASRVAQVVDAWVGPPLHNRRVRRIRQRYRIDPYAVPVIPALSGTPRRGFTGGVQVTF